jgi:WD40 repeat protein
VRCRRRWLQYTVSSCDGVPLFVWGLLAPHSPFRVVAPLALQVMLWDDAGAALTTLRGHEGKHVWCLAANGAGTLASGAEDGAVRLWDVARHLHWARRESCVRVDTLPDPPPLPPPVVGTVTFFLPQRRIEVCAYAGMIC